MSLQNEILHVQYMSYTVHVIYTVHTVCRCTNCSLIDMDTTCVIDCSFALSIVSHFLSHLRYIFHCLQDKVVQKWPTDETVRTRAVR